MVIHAGGNDLGVRSSIHLIRDVKFAPSAVGLSMVVVWSEMVGCMTWRLASSVAKLNKARVKVTKEVGRFIARNGGVVVRHRDLEVDTWHYLRSDGVHLNAVGMDLWSLGLQDGIQRALHFWRGTKV